MKKNELIKEKYKKLLGTVSDAEIARRIVEQEKIECTAATVSLVRRNLGISPFREVSKPHYTVRGKIDWNKVSELFGTMHDAEIARQFNCSRECVRQKRDELGIPKFSSIESQKEYIKNEFADCLAEETAEWIAEESGCRIQLIRDVRRELGIPTPPPSWIREYGDLLGKVTDREVAEKADKSISCVRAARIKLGIPSYASTLID